MSYTVTVCFGQNNEYEFKVDDSAADLGREEASRWLNQEFQALECEPRSMVGKILLLDVIVDVAKYSGEARFRDDGEFGKRFAACCFAVLKRDGIRIDVADMIVR